MLAAALMDSAAARVLRDLWGIAQPPERTVPGVSRNTWRTGNYWLSHADSTEEVRFRREAELLQALPAAIAQKGASWRVPELIPTARGESIAVSNDGVWRLTHDVPGEEPDMRKPGTYPLLARKLAELHEVLASVPASLKVCDRGAVERSRQLLASYGASSFRPATANPSEPRAVGAIVDWLTPRLPELEALPRQLSHGDWTPPNIKLSAHGWGVLDWEFSRVDPVVMDLSQSCSTILMWSGLHDPAEHIERLLERYSAHSGCAVSPESARAAMALCWLQNYDHWRGRQERAGGFEQVLARQPERLLAVGRFVGAI